MKVRVFATRLTWTFLLVCGIGYWVSRGSNMLLALGFALGGLLMLFVTFAVTWGNVRHQKMLRNYRKHQTMEVEKYHSVQERPVVTHKGYDADYFGGRHPCGFIASDFI